jgi:DMSO/TMAO reductase YedYZ heme-binding membrane subunit
MAGPKPKNTWLLVAGGLFAVVLVVVVLILTTNRYTLNSVVRFGALLGYLGVFLASLSSNYMRELTRYFGRPFPKVHHAVSITALTMLLVHAVTVAWMSQSLRAFLPVFTTLQAFFALGGRPAFWLILIAALAGVFRTRIGKHWKTIHWLNYVAFFLGTAHAIMIGSTFSNRLPLQILAVLMAVILVAVFVLKRMAEQKRRQKRR